MTDRLTKFNAETGEYEYRERAKTQEEFNAQRKAVIQRLGEFEDKIEQGKIVELPCVVGSEAYHLTSADTLDELGVAEIFNGKVCSFSKDEKGLWIFCRYDNGLTYWYKETDIGTKLPDKRIAIRMILEIAYRIGYGKSELMDDMSEVSYKKRKKAIRDKIAKLLEGSENGK